MATYILATLTNGTQVVSSFDKVAFGSGGYVGEVVTQRKAFNAWTITGTTHPTSGEPLISRSRRMILPHNILDLTEVQPACGMEDPTVHGYDPANFVPVSSHPKNALGYHTFTADDLPEGAAAGTEYPIRREDDGHLRRYVILTWAENVDEQVRHYLDPEPVDEFGGSDDRFADEAGDDWDGGDDEAGDEDLGDDDLLPGDADDDE